MSLTPLPRRISAHYFQEGEEAFENDIDKDGCPYAFDDPLAQYWCAGWDAANEANEVLICAEREDARLDGRYA